MDFFSNNNFDSENNENTNSDLNHEEKPFPNVFALFAKSLGVFSIFCAFFSIFIGAFICGGLAIVLAILSKGYNSNMEKNAKIGMATGIIGIVLQISVLAISVYNILTVPEFREQFNSLYEQMYGEPIDDSINDMLDDMGLPDSKGGYL